jgi:nucleotide-binding universal stress UspA family protein
MTRSQSGPLLVAIGDAEPHESALRFATTEALRAGCSLRLVHVVEKPKLPTTERLLAEAASWVGGVTHGKLPVEAVVREGRVVPVLTELSRDADLVVLQRRQLSRLQRQVTGSMSARVAGQSYAPTVTVPEGWQPRPGGDPRVVVGVDAADVEQSRTLLTRAFARAADRGACLSVVHAWQLSSGYDEAIVDQRAVAEWQDRYLSALNVLLSPLRATHPTVPVTVDIRHMHPADALVEAAERADLVVLARGRLEHPLVGRLGSVARAVIRDAGCPVEVLSDSEAPSRPGPSTGP